MGTRRLREWAAKWLRGAARPPLDSFSSGPIPPHPFRQTPFLFLTQDDPYGVIHLFTFAVVSLGLSVSVLTAPVTHQDQGLQKNWFFSATPVRFCGPRKSSVPGRVQSCVLTERMVVSQPLGAHGVGGQDVDDLMRLGWNG